MTQRESLTGFCAFRLRSPGNRARSFVSLLAALSSCDSAAGQVGARCIPHGIYDRDRPHEGESDQDDKEKSGSHVKPPACGISAEEEGWEPRQRQGCEDHNSHSDGTTPRRQLDVGQWWCGSVTATRVCSLVPTATPGVRLRLHCRSHGPVARLRSLVGRERRTVPVRLVGIPLRFFVAFLPEREGRTAIGSMQGYFVPVPMSMDIVPGTRGAAPVVTLSMPVMSVHVAPAVMQGVAGHPTDHGTVRPHGLRLGVRYRHTRPRGG
jgi:hypothetical protein